MEPVFTAQQVRHWDSATLSSQRLTPYELMERAARALAKTIINRSRPSGNVVIIACGPGNNGGDGLAVARILHRSGYRVEVLLVGERCSPDRQTNLRRLEDHPEIAIHHWPDHPSPHRQYQFAIDALLGSGFRGSLDGGMAQAVAFLNNLSAERIAIDMPTGLGADHSLQGQAFFRADRTLTIGCAKPSLLMAENQPAFGEWEVVDIGLDPHYPATVKPFAQFMEPSDICHWLKKPRKFAHKGQNGHALLVCGSMGMMGAAILAGEACLRSGAGKLTIHVPKGGVSIIHSALPEAMARPDDDQEKWTGTLQLEGYEALGIGCGIGRSPATGITLQQTLHHLKVPLVLDADALFHLAEKQELRDAVPAGTILTPHPGEFRRLLGTSRNGFVEIDLIRQFCLERHCVMILKGAFSRVCLPDGSLWINPTGNPGMATAGSGDVLTGMITGFLAQGYTPEVAARIAVYLHGLAGDLALQHVCAPESLIAGDIVAHIGMALHSVRRVEGTQGHIPPINSQATDNRTS